MGQEHAPPPQIPQGCPPPHHLAPWLRGRLGAGRCCREPRLRGTGRGRLWPPAAASTDRPSRIPAGAAQGGGPLLRGEPGRGPGSAGPSPPHFPSALLFPPVPSIVPSAGRHRLDWDTAPPQVVPPPVPPLRDPVGGRSIGSCGTGTSPVPIPSPRPKGLGVPRPPRLPPAPANRPERRCGRILATVPWEPPHHPQSRGQGRAGAHGTTSSAPSQTAPRQDRGPVQPPCPAPPPPWPGWREQPYGRPTGTQASVNADMAGVTAPRRGTLNGRISRRLTPLTPHCPRTGSRPPHHAAGPLLPGQPAATGTLRTDPRRPGTACWWARADTGAQDSHAVAVFSPSRRGGSESCCNCISNNGFGGTCWAAACRAPATTKTSSGSERRRVARAAERSPPSGTGTGELLPPPSREAGASQPGSSVPPGPHRLRAGACP